MVNRRWALGALGSVGALVIGWSALPTRQRLVGTSRLSVTETESAFNGWLRIDTHGSVIVTLAKSEMGQGVMTSLAMLLADELDADWSRVTTAQAPIDKIYNNLATAVDGLPFHPEDGGTMKRLAGWLTAKTMREIGVMMTGGSSSIKDLWLPMREAGASARAMLVAQAADDWRVPESECAVSNGVVSHPSGRSATFGSLAERAAQRPLPSNVKLKSPKQFVLIGKAVPRVDNLAKINGSARFGIDATPPGMLYAAVAMCPTLGGRVMSFDATVAQQRRGVRKVIQVGAHAGGAEGVAVIAEQPWQALQAVKEVTVKWADGEAAAWSSAAVAQRLRDELASHDGFPYYRTGDVDHALETAAKVVEAEYSAPYLAHSAMEPINCTVQFKDGAATVWTSTQVPGVARSTAAKVLGLSPERVSVQVGFLGGGFGRRLDSDFVGQAAEIALAADGAPVQTLWSREQDMTHDFYRPACAARYKAGLDAAGHLVGWAAASAGQAIVPKVLARNFGLPGVGPDKTTAEGAFDQSYEWPAARIGHAVVDLPIPIGFWRSVGHSHQAFFTESFMDEVAHAAGKDPLDFRLGFLKAHPRHSAVLKRAAELAGWRLPLAADGEVKKARGLALHHSFGSTVAEVVEVSVDVDRHIRVHRVVCVVDCGLPVNPNLIRQQMESAIVFGLSAALYGEIAIDKGCVQQSNFHDQPVLRMDACPVIEVDIMPSADAPEGVGEPGVPPLAPAVANAVFALTGQRLRSLPLKLA